MGAEASGLGELILENQHSITSDIQRRVLLWRTKT